MADAATTESIAQSTALANRLHLNGTPSFVINDRIIVGEIRSEELQSMVKGLSG